MGLLAQYLDESTQIEGIQALSFLTGIDYKTLELLDAGEVRLDQVHLELLRSVLPDMPESVYSAHNRLVLDDVVTRRGYVPEGTRLMQVLAADLTVGDMIAYTPHGPHSGSHWVEVTEIEQNDRQNSISIVAGGVRLEQILRTQMLRIARRAAEDE